MEFQNLFYILELPPNHPKTPPPRVERGGAGGGALKFYTKANEPMRDKNLHMHLLVSSRQKPPSFTSPRLTDG